MLYEDINVKEKLKTFVRRAGYVFGGIGLTYIVLMYWPILLGAAIIIGIAAAIFNHKNSSSNKGGNTNNNFI